MSDEDPEPPEEEKEEEPQELESLHFELAKCPRCGGTGVVYWHIMGRHIAWNCPRCKGQGIAQPIDPVLGGKDFWRAILPFVLGALIALLGGWALGMFNPGHH